MKTEKQLLAPSAEHSLFVCKAYFDRPNLHDSGKCQQKRFFSYDFANERQRPPKLEELGNEQKLLAYNGYRKMVEWIAKAKKDHYFKMAYIYSASHFDGKGMPMELRLFLPYSQEPCQRLAPTVCKPHWQHSLFRLDVYFAREGEAFKKETFYSQDFDMEREAGLKSATYSPEMEQLSGFLHLRQKATECCRRQGYKMLILYANTVKDLQGMAVEILRRS